MSKRISDLVIISDVDGTLIHHGEAIPPRNIEALERFVKGGGRFGIATGRSDGYTRELAERLPVNLPCVLFNGSVIYDFETKKTLAERFLPEQARSYLEQIKLVFPDLGLMVVTRDKYHDVNQEKSISQMSRSGMKRDFTSSHMEDIRSPWCKIIFLVDAEQGKALKAYLDDQNFAGVRFTYTSTIMFEMIPAESSKGEALKTLMKLKNISRENLVAIGDYHNDIEMIRLAALGVTVPEAPQEVKAVADLIVCPCGDGSLADLVEYLEGIYSY